MYMDTPDGSLGVVILAAGRGTRMRSERAKVVHTIAGKALVLWVLDTALELAPARVAVVVGHEAQEVRGICQRRLVSRPGVDVVFPLQSEQHGTGDAVRMAMPGFDGFTGDVVILYGDVPGLRAATLTMLVDRHRESGAALSLLTTTVTDPTGYGRIRRRADGSVTGIVEERDLAPADRQIREINPGIYCASAAFLRAALARLRNDNAQREYYLTDVVGIAVADGLCVTAVPVDDAEEVAGINSRADLAVLETRVRRALVARWMDAGVTFRDPATVYLEDGIEIGADTEIGPNVQLLGRTRLGRSCTVDGTAVLRDADIGDRVHLRLGTVMTDCRVGDGAVIGPFAHLRPGTELGADVHIGNFVETKKARLGAGTKANHLTYLGDAEIGAQTNIGAGTITCNYDGFAKHRTVIGDRVQIGSDTQLVAPVRVGNDAYVGAGTTVTRDVPAGELVVSRVPQRHVPGWVSRRRAKAAAATKVAGNPSPSAAPRAVVVPSRKKTTTRKTQARATSGRRGKR